MPRLFAKHMRSALIYAGLGLVVLVAAGSSLAASSQDGGAGLTPPPSATSPSGGSAPAGPSEATGGASSSAVGAGSGQAPGRSGNSSSRGGSRTAPPSNLGPAAIAFSERYLGGIVRRFRSCLVAIAPLDSKALRLRTGTGFAHSYSAQEVAGILRISVTRESEIEQLAVSALERAKREGACTAVREAAGTLVSAPVLPPVGLSSVLQSSTAALGSTGRPTATRHRRARRAHRRSTPRSSVSAASTGLAFPAASSRSGGITPLALALIMIGAIASLALIARKAMLRLSFAPSAISHRFEGAAAGGLLAPRFGDAVAPRQTKVTAPAVTAPVTAPPVAPAVAPVVAPARDEVEDSDDPGDACNLGVRLENEGDVEGALAAYRRADRLGDATAAFNLGALLTDLGDTSGALAAFERADQRGDGPAASNLGVLLEQRGDISGALAAYRRADERGDAMGSFNLGMLLAARNDGDGARAAFARAGEGDDPEIAEQARAALRKLEREA